jgi:putative NIF3 family GTP cyclohydrolase 1 type 2
LNIGLIVIHTNFDTHPYGTNMLAAKALGLHPDTLSPLIPDKQFEGFGMGVIGKLHHPMESSVFAQQCREVFGSPIRYCIGNKAMIESIAIVCGSGSSYFQNALDSQVDCFITADVKYHQFHEAKGNVMLIDPGHAEMEQFVVEGMSTILQNDECLQMQFIMSEVLTSPIQHVY